MKFTRHTFLRSLGTGLAGLLAACAQPGSYPAEIFAPTARVIRTHHSYFCRPRADGCNRC